MNYSFLTSKERDIETGLDYLEARYYLPVQGRFVSPDEPFNDQEEGDPQSWNLYSYVRNNPLRFTDPSGEARWAEIDGELHWVGDEDGEYDADLGASWVTDENNPIGGYWDFAGDQSAVEIPEPQNTIVVVGASGRVWEVQIFEPGIGGGLRNVAKSTPGVFSRVAQWLGFGKKTAPVKRTIKDIADELGYFPSKAVKDAVSGKGPREAIPSAEREIAAKFYERAAELVSGPKAAEAKALNLQRARFLREGGSPPINIHNFEP